MEFLFVKPPEVMLWWFAFYLAMLVVFAAIEASLLRNRRVGVIPRVAGAILPGLIWLIYVLVIPTVKPGYPGSASSALAFGIALLVWVSSGYPLVLYYRDLRSLFCSAREKTSMPTIEIVFEERAKRYKRAGFGMLLLKVEFPELERFVQKFGGSLGELYGINRFRNSDQAGIVGEAWQYEQAYVTMGPHEREAVSDLFDRRFADPIRLPEVAELLQSGVLILGFADGHSSVEVFFPPQRAADVFGTAADFVQSHLRTSDR
jgi:hypothetical protein